MLSAHRLEQQLAQIKALAHPVVSLYIACEGAGGIVSDAARTRVRRVLAELRHAHAELAPQLDERILDSVGHPGGLGTLAIFAGAADSAEPEIITHKLPSRLPIGHSGLASEGQLGEPWLLPLRLALSESSRVGILHVHERGVGAYESFLGEIERIVELRPPSMPGELDRLQRSKTVHPAHIPDRGSSGYDDAERHRVAWRRRFFSDAAADLVPVLAARSIDAILLLGTESNRTLFQEVAPRPLLGNLIGTGPGLPRQDASPSQILASSRELLDEHLLRRKAELLTSVSEHGVVGLDDCLAQLQRGQLRLLFVPWDLHADLFVELDTGQVATSPGQARALSGAPNARVAPVRARSKLVELADMHSTAVEFIRAGASGSPVDAIAGVAGLPRWT